MLQGEPRGGGWARGAGEQSLPMRARPPRHPFLRPAPSLRPRRPGRPGRPGGKVRLFNESPAIYSNIGV